MATAIEFNHVGKQYRLGLVSTRTLSHDLNRWWQTTVLKNEDPYLKISETNDRSKAGESPRAYRRPSGSRHRLPS